MPSVNYVIAAYLGGDRENPDPRFSEEKSFFLREHIASLSRVRHSLAQITVVCSGGDPTGFCESLPKEILGAKVVVIDRPNIGMSYGAWSDVFEKYRSEFSHYIFTEDDYLFTMDFFDTLLTVKIESMPTCGMLGGAAYPVIGDYYKNSDRQMPHMAVFIVICKSEALEMARKNGYSLTERLPYDDRSSHPDAGFFGQKNMSFAVLEAGYELAHWLDSWSSAYWDSIPGQVRWFGTGAICDGDPRYNKGNLANRSFILPIQAIGKEVLISDGYEYHTGTIDLNGVFTRSGK